MKTRALGVLAAAVVVAAACGGSDDTPPAATGAGGQTTGTSQGGGFTSSQGPGGSTGSGFEACATATIEGERIPVQMYIMFDKSGSMIEDQKWAGAVAALIAFFQDEDSAGLNVALRFFPDDDPVAGCNPNACDLGACATPLVPLGELNAQPAHSDPQQAALVDAVNSKSPGGETPMFAALGGAAQFAAANTDPDKETVVVLVTDGLPNGCNEDINAIAALASDVLQQSGVRTYTIGMVGADIGQLDQIATAGGTDSAFVVGSGSVSKELGDALEAIGTAPLACELPVPETDDMGMQIDPGLVNVTFTVEGEEPAPIGQVADAAACGSAGGWYYDDPAVPTLITLCPSSCADVQSTPGKNTLGIVLGCETVLE